MTVRSLFREITQLQYASCMKHTVVSWPFPLGHAYIQQRKLWFLCTLQFLLRRRHHCKHKLALARTLTLLLLLGGDVETNPGPSKKWLKNQADKKRYLLHREEILAKKRLQYADTPEHKKEASKAEYAAIPQRKRAAAKASYAANPQSKRDATKAAYAANIQLKRAAAKASYAANPQPKRVAVNAAYAANPQPKRVAVKSVYAANIQLKRAAAKASYAANPQPKWVAVNAAYAANPQPKRFAVNAAYAANPQPKRLAANVLYAANPQPKRVAVNAAYAANPQPKRDAAKALYVANPQPKRDAAKALYVANPQPKRDAAKALYVANAATKRVKARIQYQTHPHVFRAAVKAYYERRKDTVNCYRRGKYSMKEPKARMKAELAKMLQQNLFTLPSIRLSLRQSFKHVHDNSVKRMTKAELNKSVCRIAVKQLLDCAWKKRRETAGLLLKCVRAVNNLHLSVNDLGEKFHTVASEPFFYDTAYTPEIITGAIPVDEYGWCCIATEIGSRDKKKPAS